MSDVFLLHYQHYRVIPANPHEHLALQEVLDACGVEDHLDVHDVGLILRPQDRYKFRLVHSLVMDLVNLFGIRQPVYEVDAAVRAACVSRLVLTFALWTKHLRISVQFLAIVQLSALILVNAFAVARYLLSFTSTCSPLPSGYLLVFFTSSIMFLGSSL